MWPAFVLCVVLGFYFGLLVSDWRLTRRLERHGGGQVPVVLKAGDKEYTVKVTGIEEFGFVTSEGS